MNIVIGGLGFIGNELVRQLVRQGDEVMIVDNRNRVAPRIDDLQTVLNIETDITHLHSLHEIFQRHPVDTIFHLAAIHYIPECNADPERTLRVNVEGTQAVLRAAAAVGAKRVVFASSGAVYADAETPLAEESPVAPVDIYGLSKWFGEQLCHYQWQESRLPIIIARLFNNYGPRETNPHIIPEIIYQLKHSNKLALGKITSIRDYIHTSDTAQALIRLAKGLDSSKGVETVNIATGKGYTVMELIAIIGELIGYQPGVTHDSGRVRRFDKQTQVADINRLRQITNWEPSTSFRDGIADLLRFEGLI